MEAALGTPGQATVGFMGRQGKLVFLDGGDASYRVEDPRIAVQGGEINGVQGNYRWYVRVGGCREIAEGRQMSWIPSFAATHFPESMQVPPPIHMTAEQSPPISAASLSQFAIVARGASICRIEAKHPSFPFAQIALKAAGS